jgi:uncharacterized protein (TIGR00725 family)
MMRYVAVIGPGTEATDSELDSAREAGRRLADNGFVVVTGGLGGVMEAAAAGAGDEGGVSIGLLPGLDRSEAGAAHTYTVSTGLGEMRNALVVRAADAVFAIGGSWGTLSEIALAARTGVPVVSVAGWPLHDYPEGVLVCDNVVDALRHLVELLRPPAPRGR